MTILIEDLMPETLPLASPCDCWLCSDFTRKKDDAVYMPQRSMEPFIPQERVNSSGWPDDFRTFDERFPSRY
jgi:hypothetical protein